MNTLNDWGSKLRTKWHVRSVNMAQEVTDYSKVEELIADFWISERKAELLSLIEEGEKMKYTENDVLLGTTEEIKVRAYNLAVDDFIKLIKERL